MSQKIHRLTVTDHSPRLAARAERDPETFADVGLLVSGGVLPAELARPTVAIVGSRRPTAYGIRFVREFVPRLKDYGWNVSSGGALGIDGEVHATALRHGVPTQAYAVGPVRDPSPRLHRPIFRELRERPGCGILVPESLEPGHRGWDPRAKDWLTRNQWLVASCDALVVVEARIPSGTWSSVRLGNSYAIPVFALPGPISSPLSQGTNSMISSGYAHMILGVEELMQSLVVELGGGPYNESTKLYGGGSKASQECFESMDLRGNSNIRNLLREVLGGSEGLELAEILYRGVEKGVTEVAILQELQRLLDHGELVKSGNRLERRGAV